MYIRSLLVVFSSDRASFDEGEHEVRATVVNEIPETLIELFVGEAGEQLAGTFEGVGYESCVAFGTVVPSWGIWRPMPSWISNRVVKDVCDPVGQ